jgi:hypothetical protein
MISFTSQYHSFYFALPETAGNEEGGWEEVKNQRSTNTKGARGGARGIQIIIYSCCCCDWFSVFLKQ